MKAYLKPFAIAIGFVTTTAQAEPTLFQFALTVKEVSDPQIFVGRDKKPFQSTGHNTFTVGGRPSDYFFTVNYQHNGNRKEAICEISGVPEQIVATINPAKDGREACKTQETGRG